MKRYGKFIVGRPKNAFEGTSLRFIIQSRLPFRQTTMTMTMMERKTLVIARNVSYSLILLGFYSFHDLALHNPSGSFFAESKVRRQIHRQAGVYVNPVRLHRRKGVGP